MKLPISSSRPKVGDVVICTLRWNPKYHGKIGVVLSTDLDKVKVFWVSPGSDGEFEIVEHDSDVILVVDNA